MEKGFSVLVCDDDERDLADIAGRLEDYLRSRKRERYSVSCFPTGQSVLDKPFSPDSAPVIALIDIELEKGIRGFQLIRHLREARPEMIFIVITAHDGYLDDMMDHHVFRYIRKPVESERFRQVLDDAFEKTDRGNQSWLFSTREGTVRLTSHEILCCEADGKGTILHTVRGCIAVTDSFGNCCRKMQGLSFVKTHRSYLVNLRCVREFDRQKVRLEAETTRTIQNRPVLVTVEAEAYIASRSHYQAFCEKARQYWQKEG